MHKRDMRGKWDFIDMINGGLLALLTRFSHRVFNEGVISGYGSTSISNMTIIGST
nr:hypothetical protein [uncultured organism]